jgi:hypothetical protein
MAYPYSSNKKGIKKSPFGRIPVKKTGIRPKNLWFTDTESTSRLNGAFSQYQSEEANCQAGKKKDAVIREVNLNY